MDECVAIHVFCRFLGSSQLDALPVRAGEDHRPQIRIDPARTVGRVAGGLQTIRAAEERVCINYYEFFTIKIFLLNFSY